MIPNMSFSTPQKMAMQASTVTSHGTSSAKFCGVPVMPKKASRL